VQFYVDGSGKIYQLVDPINTLTAHAAGANSCCIGIEIGGTGEDDLLENKTQKQSVVNLVAFLVKEFNMKIEPNTSSMSGILSHHITPDGVGRKQDVGDQYWLEVIAAVQKGNQGETNLDNQKREWLISSGIAEADWPSVDYIVSQESGWNPTAQNPSSTAFGLAQFLDATWGGVGCVKTSEPVQQLKCADLYVKQRYGGWKGAEDYKRANGTY
jgi:hypothetical protein